MTLGRQIKEARLQKQMTQQEVVGDFITRNMLSKIENDSATPSIRTLEYLAERLDLQPGTLYSPSSPPEDYVEKKLEALEALLENDDFLSAYRSAHEEWEVFGKRLVLLEAEHCVRQGKLMQAEKLLDSFGRADNFPLFFLLRGQLQIKQSRFDEAVLSLNQAEHAGLPSNRAAALYSALETCHSELGSFEKAYGYAVKLRLFHDNSRKGGTAV